MVFSAQIDFALMQSKKIKSIQRSIYTCMVCMQKKSAGLFKNIAYICYDVIVRVQGIPEKVDHQGINYVFFTNSMSF